MTVTKNTKPTLITYGPGLYDHVIESFDEVVATFKKYGPAFYAFPVFTSSENGERIAVNPANVTRVSE